jgi:hypothetical protein
VLLGDFATDIPRAWLLRINDLQKRKFPNFLPVRASNQVVGGSNPSGRTSLIGGIPPSAIEKLCASNRTADRQQAGSTTAPRSGDGDRPKDDPEGVSAQRE